MRTAVLGFLYLRDRERLPAEVADISRLTHTDPRSIAGGIAIAEAARCLATEPGLSATALCESVSEAIINTHREFAMYIRELPSRCASETVLDFIAWSGQESPEFDRPIITPFVVPTVLAALYSIISQPTSWTSAVTRAIRLGGDVDTLGAIVGALAGIRHGVSGIPANLVAGVQSSERLHALAARYHAVISAADSRKKA